MTIKQHGGVFGRNPTFNDVEIEGDLSVDGTLTIGGNVITGLDYEGGWNASTNNPDLTTTPPAAGKFWIVSVAGSTNLGGITNWSQGDWALYDGSAWQRVEGGTVDLSNGVTGTLAIANGGTGSTTAANARTALGSGAVGDNVFTAATASAAQQAMDVEVGVDVQAYDATILKSADIGVSVQGYDADTAKYDDATANFTGTLQNGGSNVVVDTDIGSTVQAYDAGLQSISGLTTAADKMIYTTASDTYAVTDLTAAGRAILDDADAAAQRTTLGLGTAATTASTDYATAAQGSTADSALQPGDVDDTPVDGATQDPISSNWAYDHAALTTAHGISSFGATLVDDADAATARTTLGLGTIATQSASSVNIDGGTIDATSIGSSSRSDARVNTLYVYSGANNLARTNRLAENKWELIATNQTLGDWYAGETITFDFVLGTTAVRWALIGDLFVETHSGSNDGNPSFARVSLCGKEKGNGSGWSYVSLLHSSGFTGSDITMDTSVANHIKVNVDSIWGSGYINKYSVALVLYESGGNFDSNLSTYTVTKA